METLTHCYTASKACGCVVGITVDNPEHAADTAEWIAGCIRAGWIINRLTIEDGRKSNFNFECQCQVHKEPQP